MLQPIMTAAVLHSGTLCGRPDQTCIVPAACACRAVGRDFLLSAEACPIVLANLSGFLVGFALLAANLAELAFCVWTARLLGIAIYE